MSTFNSYNCEFMTNKESTYLKLNRLFDSKIVSPVIWRKYHFLSCCSHYLVCFTVSLLPLSTFSFFSARHHDGGRIQACLWFIPASGTTAEPESVQTKKQTHVALPRPRIPSCAAHTQEQVRPRTQVFTTLQLLYKLHYKYQTIEGL